MKILVTGASGFIGREIVSELLANNYTVVGMGKSGNFAGNLSPSFSFVRADITKYENLFELKQLEGIEVIIHSAGLAHQFGETSREEFEAVNVTGTENVLRLGVEHKIRHFILIGSTAVYGIKQSETEEEASKSNVSDRSVFSEDSPTNPQTLYAESKLQSEKICRRIAAENDIDLTIFRLAPVVGEGNVGNVARLIRAIDRKRFLWIGDGGNLKSLIDKRDVARACIELIRKKRRGTAETFNLAAEPIRMKEFVEEISANLNKKILPINIPANFLRTIFRLNYRLFKVKKITKLSETVEKWLADDVYAADKIAEQYQFAARTPTRAAVAEQIRCYKNKGKS